LSARLGAERKGGNSIDPPDYAAMRISAKADYAVRAALTLAAAEDDKPIKGERIADAQGIPLKFLENILIDLRQAGLVASQRGPEGGYRLDGTPEEITVADVIRAVDGPLASVRGGRPEQAAYDGPAEGLQTVWIALRSGIRGVLENVTLADVVGGTMPKHVVDLAQEPDAWTRR
jgi:Rrf2 family protein